MAFEFINVADAVKKTGLKIILYGPAGSGKTRTCATTGEPTLIISAEGGLLSIKDAPKNITVAEIHSRADFEEVLKYLETEGPPPWVCIDSISEIAEIVLAEELQIHKKMQMKAYGELGIVVTALVKAFRDLPCNVVMTCKQARSKDDSQGQMLYEPGMPGQKLSAALPHYFDIVAAMRVFKRDDVLTHWMQCNRDEQFEAKDRSGRLELFETPNLAEIKLKIEGTTKKAKAA
jgi:hypothetical protein